MNWINIALIVCVIIGVCLIAYLMWFMAHPRTHEHAQQEADEWARKHRRPGIDEAAPAARRPADVSGLSDADRLKFEEQHRSSGSV
jgi:hypothetical protein